MNEEEDCRVARLVYEVECTQCTQDPSAKKALYLGTSGHVLHKRQLEHMGEIRRKQTSNALYKHHSQMHPNTDPQFSSKPLRGNIQYNMDRFILEAYKIDQANQDNNIVVMNSRSEWGNRGIPWIVIND